jgi:hypothetical protein
MSSLKIHLEKTESHYNPKIGLLEDYWNSAHVRYSIGHSKLTAENPAENTWPFTIIHRSIAVRAGFLV